MKNFTLVCNISIEAHTDVEASTLEEAKEIASKRFVTIDDGTFRYSEAWLLDGTVGSPQDIQQA